MTRKYLRTVQGDRGYRQLGTFSTLIEIANIEGGEPIEIKATVDTGALHTMISQSLSEQLHMRHQGYEEFELADGTVVNYPVGTARIIVLDTGQMVSRHFRAGRRMFAWRYYS